MPQKDLGVLNYKKLTKILAENFIFISLNVDNTTQHKEKLFTNKSGYNTKLFWTFTKESLILKNLSKTLKKTYKNHNRKNLI